MGVLRFVEEGSLDFPVAHPGLLQSDRELKKGGVSLTV
jgi:hypothetical protein